MTTSTGDAPTDLDDLEAIARTDPDDALGVLEAMGDQWAAAVDLADGVQAPLDLVDNVVVAGMGGSGIVSDVVVTIADSRFDLPVASVKSAQLPAWAGRATLLIAVSYSGNTAETLSLVRQALDRGVTVIGITSGGQLAALLDEHDQTVVAVPGGGQPRHSTGSLLVPALSVLQLDEAVTDAVQRLRDIGERHGRGVATGDNAAKQLALRLVGADAGVPVVYGGFGIAAVAAYRMRCQLAENAQLRASHHTLPELCHNEIVSWDDPATAGAALWLVGDDETASRVTLLRELFPDAFAWDEVVTAEGDSPLERYASLTGLLDLVSVYAAIARGVDPTPVTPITRMKEALA